MARRKSVRIDTGEEVTTPTGEVPVEVDGDEEIGSPFQEVVGLNSPSASPSPGPFASADLDIDKDDLLNEIQTLSERLSELMKENHDLRELTGRQPSASNASEEAAEEFVSGNMEGEALQARKLRFDAEKDAIEVASERLRRFVEKNNQSSAALEEQSKMVEKYEAELSEAKNSQAKVEADMGAMKVQFEQLAAERSSKIQELETDKRELMKQADDLRSEIEDLRLSLREKDDAFTELTKAQSKALEESERMQLRLRESTANNREFASRLRELKQRGRLLESTLTHRASTATPRGSVSPGGDFWNSPRLSVLDSPDTLESANKKLLSRVSALENLLRRHGIPVDDLDDDPDHPISQRLSVAHRETFEAEGSKGKKWWSKLKKLRSKSRLRGDSNATSGSESGRTSSMRPQSERITPTHLRKSNLSVPTVTATQH